MTKKKRKPRAAAVSVRKPKRSTAQAKNRLKPAPLTVEAIADLRTICAEPGFLDAIKEAAMRYKVLSFAEVLKGSPTFMASRYREIIKGIDSLINLLNDFGAPSNGRDATSDLLAGDAVYRYLESGEEHRINFALSLFELRKLRNQLNSALCRYGFYHSGRTILQTRTNAKRSAQRFLVAQVENCFSRFRLRFSSHVNGPAVCCLSIITLEKEENLSAWIKTYRREKKQFTVQLEANRILS